MARPEPTAVQRRHLGFTASRGVLARLALLSKPPIVSWKELLAARRSQPSRVKWSWQRSAAHAELLLCSRRTKHSGTTSASLSVPVLRIVNARDIVPKVPWCGSALVATCPFWH